MKIEIPEFYIDNTTKTPHKFLRVVIMIKPEDYNDEIEENLYLSSKKAGTGESFAGVFQSFTNEKKEKVENPLSKLHFFMEQYCTEEGIDLEKEKNKIYNTYNVKSRRELSPLVIQELIRSYSTINLSR